MNKLTKIILITVLITVLNITAAVTTALAEEGEYQELPTEVVRGKVREILDMPIDVEKYGSYVTEVQTVLVEVTQGDFKGEILTLDHVLSGNKAYDFYLDQGDDVLLWIETNDGEIANAYVSEIARDRYLTYLTILFVSAILLVGRLQGAKTVVTLGITGVFIFKVLLPLILNGYNPIVVAISVASAVVTISLLVISGFNRKTFAAIIGTIGGVMVAGLIALAMNSVTKLTGLSNNEAQMLMFIPQQIEFDFRGLLFAGMIIGAMGAVMDVGISVASAIYEVRRADPALTTKRLIQSGLNVGKDMMGTMSNTLILAYTGASMPLLLVFMAYDTPLARIINLDLIATEIVRGLAGSTGLIFAIPITAVAAGMLYKKGAAVTKSRSENS